MGVCGSNEANSLLLFEFVGEKAAERVNTFSFFIVKFFWLAKLLQLFISLWVDLLTVELENILVKLFFDLLLVSTEFLFDN